MSTYTFPPHSPDAPTKAIVNASYRAVANRVEKWLDNGWATPEQRRRLCAVIMQGVDDDPE